MTDKELRFYETQAERYVARLAKLMVEAELPLTAECATTAAGPLRAPTVIITNPTCCWQFP